MNDYQKIEQFKIDNPQIPEEQVDNLVKAVASACMQAIVKNEEFNGHASGAWWTIKESFEVDVTEQSQLLPLNRDQSSPINDAFRKACTDEDIEGIKEGLRNFARINHDQDSSVLTDMAMIGNLKVIKFFVEDDFVNSNYLYKKQVDFHNTKGKIFEMAYYYEEKGVLEYLINEHNAELTKEAKEVMKKDQSEFRKTVLNMIEKKFLNYMLDMSLDNKKDDKQKPKI